MIIIIIAVISLIIRRSLESQRRLEASPLKLWLGQSSQVKHLQPSIPAAPS